MPLARLKNRSRFSGCFRMQTSKCCARWRRNSGNASVFTPSADRSPMLLGTAVPADMFEVLFLGFLPAAVGVADHLVKTSEHLRMFASDSSFFLIDPLHFMDGQIENSLQLVTLLTCGRFRTRG